MKTYKPYIARDIDVFASLKEDKNGSCVLKEDVEKILADKNEEIERLKTAIKKALHIGVSVEAFDMLKEAVNCQQKKN